MATAILDKILQSQFGKSYIFWVFLALVGANVAQWLHGRKQDDELKASYERRFIDQKYYANQSRKCDSLRVVDYIRFDSIANAEIARREKLKWTRTR